MSTVTSDTNTKEEEIIKQNSDHKHVEQNNENNTTDQDEHNEQDNQESDKNDDVIDDEPKKSHVRVNILGCDMCRNGELCDDTIGMYKIIVNPLLQFFIYALCMLIVSVLSPDISKIVVCGIMLTYISVYALIPPSERPSPVRFIVAMMILMGGLPGIGLLFLLF